jgi:hypothetical protein
MAFTIERLIAASDLFDEISSAKSEKYLAAS